MINPLPFFFAKGYSRNAPPRNYSLDSSRVQRTFNAFTSISILASLYGNGILPEIQVQLHECGVCIKLSLVDPPSCTDAGNHGTSSHREDGERADAVLLRDHRDVLLGCSLWLLGLRKQGELQCAQQPSSRLGTFPGTHMATGACGRLRPPPTLSHWLGKRLIQ